MSPDKTPLRRGPHSPAGKARVSRNALVHGLRAEKRILLDHEDPVEFDALVENVVRDLEPVGPVELAYAKQIAACLWRLERANLVEGAIMNHAFKDLLTRAPTMYTPAQRLERALIASIDNGSIEPVSRYRVTIERRLSSALRELHALQASRLLKLPVSPGVLRISLPSSRLVSPDHDGHG